MRAEKTAEVKIVAPATLREAIGVAYMHGDAVRWLLGRSALLGVDFASVPARATIVDGRKIADFRSVVYDPERTVLGAFAREEDVVAHPEIRALYFPGARVSLMRLCAFDARLRVATKGTVRTTPLEAAFDEAGALTLAPYEAPVSIELPQPRPGLGIAERRRTTSDGDASFDLRAFVRLRIGVLGRLEHVGIRVRLDDGPPIRATFAEAQLERREPERAALLDASRAAAAIFEAGDARTSAAVRALPALMMSALADAVEAARGSVESR